MKTVTVKGKAGIIKIREDELKRFIERGYEIVKPERQKTKKRGKQ